MEQKPLSRKEIVDIIVREATLGLFVGDRRDGDAPPITLKNFTNEMIRYGAKALRGRLSRLSDAALLSEATTALEHVEARQKQLQANVEEGVRRQREDEMRAIRERFAEYGRRHGLQPAIVAAAGYYRGLNNITAKQAWHAIKQTPFGTSDGEIVVIEGNRDDEMMRVEESPQRSKRGGIKLPHWQKRYWPVAKG